MSQMIALLDARVCSATRTSSQTLRENRVWAQVYRSTTRETDCVSHPFKTMACDIVVAQLVLRMPGVFESEN